MKSFVRKGRHSVVVEVICWAYFLLFAYAAFDKLMGYDKFVVTMGQSGMLTPYAGVLGWLVPLVEIVLALLLVLNWFRLLGLYAAFALMTMFTTYIFIVLYVMEKELCGCGAAIEALGWGWHMVLNIIFLILAIIAIVISREAQRREIS